MINGALGAVGSVAERLVRAARAEGFGASEIAAVAYGDAPPELREVLARLALVAIWKGRPDAGAPYTVLCVERRTLMRHAGPLLGPAPVAAGAGARGGDALPVAFVDPSGDGPPLRLAALPLPAVAARAA
jgi:hypothetical protein